MNGDTPGSTKYLYSSHSFAKRTRGRTTPAGMHDRAAESVASSAPPVEGTVKPLVEPPLAKRARVATRQPMPLDLLFEEYRFVLPKAK